MADRKLEVMNELMDGQIDNYSNKTLGVMFAVLRNLVKYLIAKENENEFSK
jgi:hypothetical protein